MTFNLSTAFRTVLGLCVLATWSSVGVCWTNGGDPSGFDFGVADTYNNNGQLTGDFGLGETWADADGTLLPIFPDEAHDLHGGSVDLKYWYGEIESTNPTWNVHLEATAKCISLLADASRNRSPCPDGVNSRCTARGRSMTEASERLIIQQLGSETTISPSMSD